MSEYIGRQVWTEFGQGKILAVFRDETACVELDTGAGLISPLSKLFPKARPRLDLIHRSGGFPMQWMEGLTSATG